MDLGDQDEQCRYHYHHVLQDSVFKTQLFIDFRARLHASMLSSTSPITDSLVANAPGIHSHLRSVEARVVDLTRIIESELGNSRLVRETNDRAIQVLAATSSKDVKANLNEIRRDIRDLKNDNINSTEALRRMMSRIASQVHLVVEEEVSLLSQRQRASQQGLSVPDSDHNIDIDLDLPEAAPILVPGAVPAQLEAQQESSPAQPEILDSTVLQLAQEPAQPSSSCAPLSLENVESLMAMISAAAPPPIKPLEMPTYTMVPRDASLDDHWQEWFYGVSGNPSILQLNEWYNTSWRRGSTKTISNANAVMYMYKKNIIHAVLKSFPPDREIPLGEREMLALVTVKKCIECVGSISMFERSLPKKPPKRRRKGTPSSAPQ